MRKAYYVYYPRNFFNEYSLRWVWSAYKDQIKKLEDQGYERISRARALDLVYQEIDRMMYNQSSSGYADAVIYPWYWENGYDDYEMIDQYSPYNWTPYYCSKHIVGKIDEI